MKIPAFDTSKLYGHWLNHHDSFPNNLSENIATNKFLRNPSLIISKDSLRVRTYEFSGQGVYSLKGAQKDLIVLETKNDYAKNKLFIIQSIKNDTLTLNFRNDTGTTVIHKLVKE